MAYRHRRLFLLAFCLTPLCGFLLSARAVAAPDGLKLPAGVKIEEQPTSPRAKKIVLIAGSSAHKPGEHDYVNGCLVLLDLLRQTPDVFPVLAIDWPENPQTFEGAKAIVMLFDGGNKHALLKDKRFEQIQKPAGQGVGIVQLHQVVDYPKAAGDQARALAGAAWEPGYSKRGHWVATFDTFPNHPIFQGVSPFTIDDGWLTSLRFSSDSQQRTTPLLRTLPPKSVSSTPPKGADPGVVAWVFETPQGSRAFTFTGGHLHKSFAEEGYRRFLVQGILWSAGLEIPGAGAPVALDPTTLKDQ